VSMNEPRLLVCRAKFVLPLAAPDRSLRIHDGYVLAQGEQILEAGPYTAETGSRRMKIKRIAHVAVAVPSIDEAFLKLQRVLGLDLVGRETVASQRVEAAMLPLGDAGIELIEPKGNEAVARFLATRGPGLHHVAVEVEGIEEVLALLKTRGVELIDEAPRIGAQGHKVAFVHPRATGGVLIELVEP